MCVNLSSASIISAVLNFHDRTNRRIVYLSLSSVSASSLHYALKALLRILMLPLPSRRLSMHWTCTTIYLIQLYLLGAVKGTWVQRVVDNQYGDEVTGQVPSYHPADQWSEGNGCSDCSVTKILDPCKRKRLRNIFSSS